MGELGQECRVVSGGVRALELRREGAHAREVGLPCGLFVGIGRCVRVVAELVGDGGDGLGDGSASA